MKELKNSVHKTFAILEHFTAQKPHWGVTELAKEIGSNKSTVFRFLTQMLELGILDRDRHTDRYTLGLKLFELGNRVNLRSALVEKTHPQLVSVGRSIAETVHIGILKNHQVFYIDKVESPQGLKISSHIGSYSPAYATGLGKVLLAFLSEEEQDNTLAYLFDKNEVMAYTKRTITDKLKMKTELKKVKRLKYAIDREEYEVGLICVAIPIFNQNQEVIASLSASGPSSRFEEDAVQHYVATLQMGAMAIQREIGNFKLL